MSSFRGAPGWVGQLIARVEQIVAPFQKTVDNGGRLRGTPDSVVGVFPSTASSVAFDPTTPGDWTGPPDDVQEALDELAATVGGGGGDASTTTYTPADNSDWTGSADPGNVDDALDQLAERLTDAEDDTYTKSLYYGFGALDDLGTGTVNAGSFPNGVRSYAFVDSSSRYVGLGGWLVPADWAGGAIDVIVHYGKQTSGTGNVRWQASHSTIVLGTDTISETGTDVQLTQAVTATATALIYEEVVFSALMTPGAVGDMVRLTVGRLGGDAADTYASTIQVFGVEVQYTAKVHP